MSKYLSLAQQYKYKKISGRYLNLSKLNGFLETLNSNFLIVNEGFSVENRKIESLNFGHGSTKLLIWSQMHGNESTCTKGLIDFLTYLNQNKEEFNRICGLFTIKIIPLLNPDGAEIYTRENANGIDLNRDALNLSQPESRILRGIIENFKPNYNFNLHDQRSIYGIFEHQLPATMSFLTASFDETREFNEARLKAAGIINGINEALQEIIPNQVGRFDDDFNLNCTGEYFTSLGIPTILFEAGHYKNDYNRDKVRNFAFVALFSGINTIIENVVTEQNKLKYLKIQQNNICFYDFLFRNVKIIENNVEKMITFAIQYNEILIDNKIEFVAFIAEPLLDNTTYCGHEEIDAKGAFFKSETGNYPVFETEANFFLDDIQYINAKIKQ